MRFINYQIYKLAFILPLLNALSLKAMDATVAQDEIPTVRFVFQPQFIGKNSHLIIESTFKGSTTGQTYVGFPDEWAGVDYKPQVKNIQFVNAHSNGQIPDKHDCVLVHNPLALITMKYELHQNTRDSSDVHGAIVRPDLFHFPGYAIGGYPVYNPNDPLVQMNVEFEWRGLPPDWFVMSSYGLGLVQKNQGTLPQLGHSLQVVRRAAPLHFDIDGKPVYLSLHGKFDITPLEMEEVITKIIRSQRSFFDDFDFPFYFMSLVEGTVNGSLEGTQLRNCFTSTVPSGISRTSTILHLAHEHFHNWVGDKIWPINNSESVAWWYEGFTEYYCRVLSFRTGLISLQDFCSEVNEILLNYYQSPVRNASNHDIENKFWAEKSIEKLPYLRGFVVALYLNNLILKSTVNQSCLDNVMWDLFDIRQFSEENFKSIVRKYVPTGIDSELKRYIELGETIDLSQLTELPITTTHMLVIDHGYPWSQIIYDIDPVSDAYRAGLRNGDEIEALLAGSWKDFGIDYDESQQVLIQMKDGRKIAYTPKRRENVSIPQLDITTDESKTKVVKWFGGKDRHR